MDATTPLSGEVPTGSPCDPLGGGGPRSLDATTQVVVPAILCMWRSIHSEKRSCVIGTWSRSAGLGRYRRGRSASPCATWPSSTARDGAGCSAPRTASGTAESVSAGCRPTLLDVWFARRADTTTWDVTASASSAASASVDRKSHRSQPILGPPPGRAKARPVLPAEAGRRGGDLFSRVQPRLHDAVDQARREWHQRCQQPQPPPDWAGFAADHLVTTESAVPVEGTGHASAASALVQLQAAVTASRILPRVDKHGGLITPRTEAGRDKR